MRIPATAWKAHAKHGDFKGKCTAAKIKKAQKKLNAKKHHK